MVWMARSVALMATSLAASFDIEPSPRSKGTPLTAIHEARQVSSRAASIWVARSASGNEMPWLSMIGRPNASRSVVYAVAYSNAARANPIVWAATIGRVCSKAPDYPAGRCSKLTAATPQRSSGSRTRPNLGGRQMQHHGGHRNGVILATGQQSRVFGQLSGVDLAGGDAPQHFVGPGELFALPVLAAGQFDAGPDAILLAVGDGVLGAPTLLRQRAAAQALDPCLGGRPLVRARLRRAVTTVVIGIAEP